MEMIDRYIYAVTKRLPKAQRMDIEQELRGLIDDMLDTRMAGKVAEESDIRDVLYELGHPSKLAHQYRGGKNYLIGPELYDSYVLILKIGFITTVSAMSIIFIIQTILNPLNILQYFVDYIISFFTIVIPMAIGWTTLGFGIAEYFSRGKLENLTLQKNWDPAKLAPVPDSNKRIKRSDSIIAIIFYIIIIIFLTFSHDYFGVWLFDDGQFSNVVLFLNDKSFPSLLIFIVLLFGLNIFKELLKLIYEKWSYSLIGIITIINTLSVIILFSLKSHLWNKHFISELTQEGVIVKGSDGYSTVTTIWEQLTFWIMMLAIVGFIIDIIVSFIKARKYK